MSRDTHKDGLEEALAEMWAAIARLVELDEMLEERDRLRKLGLPDNGLAPD